MTTLTLEQAAAKAGIEKKRPVVRSLDSIFADCKPNKQTGCLIWQKGKLKSGYGKVRTRGIETLVHREVYRLTFGEIPNGRFVCHSCDIPACCNPEHLWLGSPKDNTRDMMSKGRAGFYEKSPEFIANLSERLRKFNERNPGWQSGEKSVKAKLTEQAVREIRSNNSSTYMLAKKFGVSAATILDARNGHTWKHVQ